jgi:hypothetical protein
MSICRLYMSQKSNQSISSCVALTSAHSFHLLAILAVLYLCTAAPTSPATPGLAIGQIRRQDNQQKGVQPCEEWTELIGDGNPHQNYLHKQMSEDETCDPSHTCAVSYTNGGSVSWSISGGAGWEWISGGFDVSSDWSWDNTYTCSGDPGDVVCVWYNIAHTAYTVRKGFRGDCLDVDTTPYVMFSPNSNNVGAGYYCVVGAQFCRNINAQYWDYNGPAGGPPRGPQ